MKKAIVFVLLPLLVLSGCATMGEKEGAGTFIGAGTGALLGSTIGGGEGRVVAVAIGTLAGAIVGSQIGKSMDATDRMMMERNAQYSLENTRTNATTEWRNPDTGNYGAVTPLETYQTSSGTYCREYIQDVVVAGERQQAYGTACRQPDGTWKIIR
jgi:surface antigen